MRPRAGPGTESLMNGRTVKSHLGKGTTHEEPSDVLVVCVQGCLSDQVVSEEGIRCEGTQVASRNGLSRHASGAWSYGSSPPPLREPR